MPIKLKYTLTILLTVAVFALCLFLPLRLLQAQDATVLHQNRQKEIASYSAHIADKMTLIDKIALYNQVPTTEMEIPNGRVQDVNQIPALAQEELGQLIDQGLALSLPPGGLALSTTSASLRVSVDDPGASAIFWHVSIQTADWSGTLVLEDSTGKLMALMLIDQHQKSWDNSWGQINAPVLASYLGMDYLKSESPNSKKSTTLASNGFEQLHVFQKDNQQIEYMFYTQDNTITLTPG